MTACNVTAYNVTERIIQCSCPPGHEQVNFENGVERFGCLLRSCESSLNETDKKEGQECQFSLKAEPFWSCQLGETLNEEGNKCIPQCDLKENTLKCVEENKVCQSNPTSNKPSCVYQPGFNDVTIEPPKTECQMAQFSHITTPLEITVPSFAYGKISGPLLREEKSDSMKISCPILHEPDVMGCYQRMIYSASFGLKSTAWKRFKSINLLEQNILDGMDILFTDTSGYEGSSLLYRDIIDERDRVYNNVQIILKFNRNQTAEEIEEKLVGECNKKRSLTDGSLCVIPNGLHFDMKTLNQSQVKILDPCDEGTPNYCPAGTDCLNPNTNTSAFACACSNGFKISKHVSLENAEIDHCEDIDECKEKVDGCPQGSTCVNTLGSFRCECPEGQIWRVNETDCVPVCDGIVCSNGGTCQVRNKHFWECK